MSSSGRFQWSDIRLGDEMALRSERSGVTLLFGRGPAVGEAEPESRAHEVLLGLAPQLRTIRWCRQVHGCQIETLDHQRARSDVEEVGCVGPGDGLLTGSAGLGLLVWTADCVPILIWGGGAVAAIHAGWRGTAAGIARIAVERLRSEFEIAASDLAAVLGPAVGRCHYPVGPDVIERLRSTGVDEVHWRRDDRVGLRALIEEQLRSLGIRQVERVGGCTACDSGLASYRRDGLRAGRQLSVIFRVDPVGTR